MVTLNLILYKKFLILCKITWKIGLLGNSDSFLDLKKLAWPFARNECRVNEFIAVIKAFLYSSNVVGTVKRDALFVVSLVSNEIVLLRQIHLFV